MAATRRSGTWRVCGRDFREAVRTKGNNGGAKQEKYEAPGDSRQSPPYSTDQRHPTT